MSEFQQLAVTEQPRQPAAAAAAGRNNVTIRNFTPADAEFNGHLMVEAFRGKFEHALGKERIGEGKQIMARIAGKMSPKEQTRNFIAEVNNQRAGILGLKFSEHLPDTSDEDCSIICGGTNCCSACRLLCFFTMADADVKKGYCYIAHICVDENFRGQGVGKVLMERAEAEARQFGCRTLFLDVTQSNRARNLYERQGFKVSDSSESCCASCAIGEGRFYRMEKKLN